MTLHSPLQKFHSPWGEPFTRLKSTAEREKTTDLLSLLSWLFLPFIFEQLKLIQSTSKKSVCIVGGWAWPLQPHSGCATGSVGVISANKLPLQERNQLIGIRCWIQFFLESFVSFQGGKMCVLPSAHASDNVLSQPSVLFSVGLLRTKFQVPNFLLSSLWQHGRGKHNVPTAT